MKHSITFITSLILISFHGFSQSNKKGFYKGEGSRQVHLDFHATEKLVHIGENWKKEDWQQRLKEGYVNSINVFAKGHHGWAYYNTEVGKRHPNLKFDLIKAQIEANKEIGASSQAYVTVGWSVLDAREHPEWVSTGIDGKNSFVEMEAKAQEK